MANQIEIVIDPIIEQDKLTIPKDLKFRDVVCLSLKRSKIKFCISVRGKDIPKSIVLKSIRITPINRLDYFETKSEVFVISNIENDKKYLVIVKHLAPI